MNDLCLIGRGNVVACLRFRNLAAWAYSFVLGHHVVAGTFPRARNTRRGARGVLAVRAGARAERA